MARLNSCLLLLFAILSLTSGLGSSTTPAMAVKGNPLRSNSMYSSTLLSINTDRPLNNSFDISPHKTNTSPSLLFQNLSKLRVPIFDGLDMSSIDLHLFTNLPSYSKMLSFHSCKLQGYFPVEVFPLPNLKRLYMSLNLDLYGHLPRSNWSSPLEIMDLSSTSFFGELPAQVGNLKSLRVLWLRKCNFTGSVPASLGNLTQLARLDLSINKLTGQISPIFANLQSVILFFLSSNNFLGPIPDMFINMTKLLYVGFSNNRCNASIPMSLLSVPSMIDLDLSNNLLSGHITRVQASSLKSITLFGNQLEGSIPPSLTDLSNITTLLLSSNRFTGLFDLKTLSQMSKMETLDLSHDMITLSNVDHDNPNTNPLLLFQNLNKLRVLSFDGLDMSSILFTNLPSSLQVLSFHSYKLQGYFPVEVCLLPNLICLDFSPNLDLYGHLLRSNWSSLLQILDLSSTRFFGKLTIEIGKFKSLQVQWLHEGNSTRLIPASLGNFTQLARLYLSVKMLEGQIPPTLFSLQSLILSYIPSNNFSGTKPNMFPAMTKLVYFDFSNDRFNASIPMSLVSVQSMMDLDLSNNLLSGHINRVRVTSLRSIKLFGNQLEVSIPPSLIDPLNLTDLLLSSNRFTSLLDLKMVAQTNKTEPLDLSHNMITLSNVDNDFDHTLPSLSSPRLSGWNLTRFPRFVGTARNLNTLDLPSDQVQGRIPAWMWEARSESLAYLDLSYNLLTSSEKAPWINLFLVLHFNMIQGPIPTQLPNSTMFFSITDNEFVRRSPTPICQAKNLETLDLSTNYFNSGLGNFSTILEVLDMQGNQISGSLSNFTFQESNNLRCIHSNKNQLEGELPQLLMNWHRVEVFDLGMSMSSDAFPSRLDTMSNLRVLVLWSNGTISHSNAEFSFPQLRILHISFNKFSRLLTETYFLSTIAVMSKNKNEQKLQYGGIYYQDSVILATQGSGMPLGKVLSIFSTLDFSSNSFEGPILNAIGNLISHEGLNHLIGAIPSSLGKLSELEWSYMSSHELAGRIPNELTQLTSRVILNLFDNHLVEPIPHGNRFNTYPTNARAGYKGLSGFPLSNIYRIFQNSIMMPHQIHDKYSLLSEHVIQFLGVGCFYGVVIGLIIERSLCRRWHQAIERGFEFFTWSFTPTRSTKQNSKTRGPFVAVAVVMILIQFFDPAASTLAFSNQCSTPITICNINASGPIIVERNKAYSMEPSASLEFWAYKKSRDNMCTNVENPVATLAVIDFDNNGCSYGVSVAYGYNLGVKIMPLGGTGCLPAACTARLDDCPDNLKARGPDNVVIACNPPNCTESTLLCSLYSSLMGNSQCQKPGSGDQYSSKNARCDLPVDLAIIFKCD